MQLIKCVNSNQLEGKARHPTLFLCLPVHLFSLSFALSISVMGCLLPRLMNKLIATATAKVIKVAVSSKPSLDSRHSSLEQNGNNNKTLFKNFENVAQICAKCKKICLGGGSLLAHPKYYTKEGTSASASTIPSLSARHKPCSREKLSSSVVATGLYQ